jgi:putative peptide zinc metalloprotease protein
VTVKPPPAKLELLVRRGGDEAGFEIKRVGSGAAWVKMRPQRVPPEAWELAEVTSRVGRQRGFILKNRRTDRFLMLSEEERFLWDRMDGRASVQEIATAYLLTYGQFDFQLIPGLIRKLQRAQLLTLTPGSRLRQALAQRRERWFLHAAEAALTALERITISSRRVQSLFDRMYRWGGFLLFTWAAAVVCVLLGIVGVVVGWRLWFEWEVIARGLGNHPVLALISVKLLFLVTLMLHQVVHGLALIHYGRRVHEFGFTFLHGFVPTFYVDVTDIFMASRRARVVTAVSGTLVHLVLGTLWFLLAFQVEPSFLKAFATASGILQWQAFALSLYPFCFIEMDGYHVLVDLLGLPTLKSDALAYVRGLFNGSTPASSSREHALWIGYVGLSAVSITAFVLSYAAFIFGVFG